MTKTRQAGYSLMEMLVAVALMATIAVSFAPLIRRPSDATEFQAFVDGVNTSLARARTDALIENRETRVEFDLDRRIISVAHDVMTLAIPNSVDIDIVAASGDVLGRRASIRFFPDGASTGGNIRLSSDQSSASLAVNWLTGVTRLEQP